MPCAAAYFIPSLGEANFSSVVGGEIIFETIALVPTVIAPVAFPLQ